MADTDDCDRDVMQILGVSRERLTTQTVAKSRQPRARWDLARVIFSVVSVLVVGSAIVGDGFRPVSVRTSPAIASEKHDDIANLFLEQNQDAKGPMRGQKDLLIGEIDHQAVVARGPQNAKKVAGRQVLSVRETRFKRMVKITARSSTRRALQVASASSSGRAGILIKDIEIPKSIKVTDQKQRVQNNGFQSDRLEAIDAIRSLRQRQ